MRRWGPPLVVGAILGFVVLGVRSQLAHDISRMWREGLAV